MARSRSLLLAFAAAAAGAACAGRLLAPPFVAGRSSQVAGPGGREEAVRASNWSYAGFARTWPFSNNVLIATLKTSAADLVAQRVIEGRPLGEVDWKRNFVFCLFGAVYLGGFQYWYQINVFKRLFPGVEAFTSQPWLAKLRDVPGLADLGAQVVLDLGMLCFVYLPTFYTFKAFVLGGSWSPSDWTRRGLGSYAANFSKDARDVVRVLGPADLVCFSVPLYLRLPVRHVVSFFWTAYLSFARGTK